MARNVPDASIRAPLREVVPTSRPMYWGVFLALTRLSVPYPPEHSAPLPHPPCAA